MCNCCCWLSFFLSVSASLWPHTLSCDLCAGTQSQWTNVAVEHIKDNNKSGTGVSMCVSMCMWLHAYLVVSSLKIVSVNPRFVSTPKWVNVKVRLAWVCVSVCGNGQFEYNALENAFAEWKPFYLNAYAKWRKQQQHQHKSSCEAVGWWGGWGDKEVGSICMQQPHQMIYFIVQSNEVSNELQLQHSQSNSFGLPMRSFLAHFALFCVCASVCVHVPHIYTHKSYVLLLH